MGTVASKIDGGWDTEPNTQYHIQTDEGPERYFKYQTISGQYRKERRLQDGSVVGTYGWVDADGYLRLNDYVADSKGKSVTRVGCWEFFSLVYQPILNSYTDTPDFEITQYFPSVL